MKCKYCGAEIGNSIECHLCCLLYTSDAADEVEDVDINKLGKQRVQYVQNLFILIKNIVLIVEVLQFIVSLSQ